MILTPSKAHSQFMPALSAITESLKTYGHSLIELVFTDNVHGDKGELERVLPSLREGIIPVADCSTYPKLVLPLDWKVTILSSAYQINTRLSSLMEDIKDDKELFVALDMEWSVDRSSSIQGRVAVISIATNNEIYLLQV
jgi:hypothetical protein